MCTPSMVPEKLLPNKYASVSYDRVAVAHRSSSRGETGVEIDRKNLYCFGPLNILYHHEQHNEQNEPHQLLSSHWVDHHSGEASGNGEVGKGEANERTGAGGKICPS